MLLPDGSEHRRPVRCLPNQHVCGATRLDGRTYPAATGSEERLQHTGALAALKSWNATATVKQSMVDVYVHFENVRVDGGPRKANCRPRPTAPVSSVADTPRKSFESISR